MEQVAKFYIDDTFIVTGRGLVFVGHIIEGIINLGNYIEFNFYDNLIKRKIIGIELIRHPIHSEGIYDQKNMGIIIQCQSEEEMKMIRESNLKDFETLIFEI